MFKVQAPRNRRVATDPALEQDDKAGADVAVRIKGVAKHFRDVTWDVYAGQMSMIVGPSGCGKTTLLSVIAGILTADSGSVTIFGEEVSRMKDRALTRFRAKRIGFIFQQYNLLPALTAAENAAIPLVIAGWSKPRAVAQSRKILSSLGMAAKFDSYPNQLSGGQQQRVAISRALVHEPQLLVCDEPTAALDQETGHSVMQLLLESAVKPDRAVVVVTHDNRIFHFGDRIAHMDDGQIVQVETRAGSVNRDQVAHQPVH